MTKSDLPTKRTVSIYVDEKTLDVIDKDAKRAGVTRNTLITQQLKSLTPKEVDDNEKPLIIVTSSHKGGVAKTITAGNLAVEFALSGKKTLAIDLDGQGSLSLYLGVYDEDGTKPSIAEVMIPNPATGECLPLFKTINKAKTTDADGNVITIDNLDVVPCDLRFDSADSLMKNGQSAGIDTRLRNAIEDLLAEQKGYGEKLYDVIIIDCPPALGLTATNAIIAMEAGNKNSLVIIPVRADGFSKRGMQNTINAIKNIAKQRRTEEVNWVLLATNNEPRTNIARYLETTIHEDYPYAQFFKTKINKAVAITESSLFFTPLAYYENGEKSRESYIDLMHEIEEMSN